jgi:dephospho-CoA kinase
MLKVAVTGGIGSGKSVVCKIFRALNIPVFDADTESKNILNNNKKVRDQLIKLFGNNIYDNQNKINRQKLSSIIFTDKSKILEVNSIVHPYVIMHYNDWLNVNVQFKYTILETAILFESGYEKLMDYIITVFAPENIRISRTIERDNCEKSTVLEKMRNQINDEIKVQKSHCIIYNDDKQLVIPQILEINNQLVQLSN